MLLTDRVAIVTGGGRGIGRGISKRFAQEGATVVIAQRDAKSGLATCREIESAGGLAYFVRTDIGVRKDVEELVSMTAAMAGALDILVNNGAITGVNGPFLEMPQETWDRVIRVNLTGAFMCSQAAARAMTKAGGGVIINISSSNALLPQPACCAYAPAKGGLETLTRAMAIDLAQYNIRVNTIAPGPIQSRSPDGDPPRATKSTLLGRSGLCSEVAAAAVFLASDESSFITGDRIAVGGGVELNGYSIYGVPFPMPQ